MLSSDGQVFKMCRSHIDNLPFDGEGLFNNKTDNVIDNFYKKRNTAIHTGLSSQTHQKSYHPSYWRCPYLSSSTRYFSDKSFHPCPLLTTSDSLFRNPNTGPLVLQSTLIRRALL